MCMSHVAGFDEEFVMPSIEVARQAGRDGMFLEGNADVWEYQHEDLQALGPGMSLYFWMLVSRTPL